MISVVICTYNRSSFLRHCLGSLQKQTASLDKFEVVVVNNNSIDDTEGVAKDFESVFPFFKYCFEDKQGLSFARNKGYEQASCDWVAYLDDDAVARLNWVEIILETISKGDFDVFGGVYTAWHALRECPKWFSSEWETNTSISEVYTVLEKDYPSGGNCVYRKSLLLKHGGFSPTLGMKGNSTAYGEETLLIDTMRQHGVVVGFVPELLIDHCVIERKYSLIWRLNRSFAIGRDSVTICNESSMAELSKSILKCVCFLVCSPVKALCRWVVTKEYYWQNVVLDSFSRVTFHLGRLVGGVKAQCR
ncbi:glycosyltransferase family 2 protein [Halodesulfovibrio sp.]|uniref:glycosyltransferase family 2 protein n=1 Tax=Halodesulfovibrio sp. TaxID=1912772 RepID=UPI0025BBFCD3|nr:glycosyltransferase family 2 protein [Halodesulfovibrio sp.]